MTAREAHLKELKAGSREDYFEGLRQILDQVIDNFPLDKWHIELYTDVVDALMALDRDYKRRDLVKGDTHEVRD